MTQTQLVMEQVILSALFFCILGQDDMNQVSDQTIVAIYKVQKTTQCDIRRRQLHNITLITNKTHTLHVKYFTQETTKLQKPLYQLSCDSKYAYYASSQNDQQMALISPWKDHRVI